MLQNKHTFSSKEIMKEKVFIFPHQLFAKNKLLDKKKEIVLIEHPRYFTDFAFHKQKLILHRASMQEYYHALKNKGYSVLYIECMSVKKYLASLPQKSSIHFFDPVDHDLINELKTFFEKRHIITHWYESPMFLTPRDWIEKNMSGKKHFLMHTFYVKQRKRLNILVKNGKPVGGKWSFDQENQENIPSSVRIPEQIHLKPNAYVVEAQKYVRKHFKNNPGESDSFNYATNTKSADRVFTSFLEKRFKLFGIYQDAIKKDEPLLFHSMLTPSLNTGLLTPDYVVEKTLAYAAKYNIPLNSLEGFIRQIIGWREFVRAVYQITGKQQKKANYFNHTKKLPESFYIGSTGIEPVDATIKKLLHNAYSHHIERLMILGNFMLLLQIDPDDVYRWFMEMYIDSYDWVMVPNVYGMSQYADPSMTTKPYISSSNYVLKMSDYQKGTWCKIWDALFWHFLYKHQKKLSHISRMTFMLSALKKKSATQISEYQHILRNGIS